MEGKALKSANFWFQNNLAKILLPNANLSSQNTSSILKYLGNVDLQYMFFQTFYKSFFSYNSSILIDSTSFINNINSSLNAWGMAAGDIRKNVSTLMLVDKKSKIPFFFKASPGCIPDVSLLKNTLDDIKLFNCKCENIILDAGFFSDSNIKALIDNNLSFVTRMPKNRTIFNHLLDKHFSSIENSKNAIIYNKRVLFIITDRIKINNKSVYAHLILDPEKRGRDIKIHTSKVLNDNIFFDKNKLKSKGFFLLISSYLINPDEILPTYYSRQAIEEVFGVCKSANNAIPLRRHNDNTIRGFLMICFFTVIVYMQFRDKLNGLFSVSDALLILRGLKTKYNPNNKKVTPNELTKNQKEIFKVLNIEI